MELVTTYRFKSGISYVGIVGKKDPMILSTTNENLAVHHFKDEFDWVCRILGQAGVPYTFQEFNHLYDITKYYSR